MAKKKVIMEKEILGKILEEQLYPEYSADVVKRDLEDDVDEEIKRILRMSFDPKYIIGKKQELNKLIMHFLLIMEKMDMEDLMLWFLIYLEKMKYPC